MPAWNEALWFSLFAGVALKSTAVLAAAWLGSWLLHRQSASARHLLWTTSAVAILALPFLSATLPSLRIPVAAALLPASSTVFSAATVSSRGGSSVSEAAFARTNVASSFRFTRHRPDWKIWLMAIWAMGVLAGFAQLLAGYISMSRVRRRGRPFSGRDLVRALSETLGIRRPVEVLATPPGSMPMTFGILRSVVLMPSDAMLWTEDRRRVVLLHELAHVRRGDVATHWIARIALAVYWWNPLAWKAWRECLTEGERAADDLVLNAGARASEYASHLLDVARSMQRAPAMGVAMARRSQLEGRLVAILDSGINRKPTSRAWGFAAAALALAVVTPLAAVRAQDAPSQALVTDVDAAIRSATSQNNPAILEDAAKAAEQSRKFDAAQKLLEAALAIHGSISGPQSKEYGVGLLKLGEVEARQNNKSAEEHFARAAQILSDQPEAGRALIHLGTTALTKGDYARAFDDFRHAQLADSAHAGIASMWMGVVRSHERKDDEADALFQNAVSLQDSKSPEAAVVMRVYEQFLQKQNRAEDASAMEARAMAAQKANAQPAALPAGVYRIGGSVKPPSVLTKVDPYYSELARLAKLQGTVTLQVEIGTDGLAHNPSVTQALGLGLDDKAIDAISQWHFQPGTKDGQPVAVVATIEINFRLL